MKKQSPFYNSYASLRMSKKKTVLFYKSPFFKFQNPFIEHYVFPQAVNSDKYFIGKNKIIDFVQQVGMEENHVVVSIKDRNTLRPTSLSDLSLINGQSRTKITWPNGLW